MSYTSLTALKIGIVSTLASSSTAMTFSAEVVGLKSGNVNRIEKFDWHNAPTRTPLMEAVRNSQYMTVKRILEACSSCIDEHYVCPYASAKDADGNTALHFAARNGSVEICKHLIAHGVEIEALNEKEEAPLHAAVEHNRYDVVDYLLGTAGAHVDSLGSQYFTPLLWATFSGNIELIKLLIEKYNANVFAVDRNGNNLLYIAVDGAYWHAVFRTRADELSPERVALADKNRAQVVETILTMRPKAGILLTTRGRRGDLPIHYACRIGALELVKTMVKHNESIVNERRPDQSTPLHLAAQVGDVDIIDFLPTVNLNLDINQIRKANVIDFLLTVNSDLVNQTNESGQTALHYAARNGHSHAVVKLIESGADASLKDSKSGTAFRNAAVSGHTNLFKILKGRQLLLNETSTPCGFKDIYAAPLARTGEFVDVVKLLTAEQGPTSAALTRSLGHFLESAINFDRKDTALYIIQSKHWKSACKIDTVTLLIEKMPIVANAALTRCLSFECEDKHDEAKTYSCDYKILEIINATSQPTTSTHLMSGVHPLTYMLKNNRADLLSHPVTSSYISIIWQLNDSIFFLSLLLLRHFFYLCLFTVFMANWGPKKSLFATKQFDNSTNETDSQPFKNCNINSTWNWEFLLNPWYANECILFGFSLVFFVKSATNWYTSICLSSDNVFSAITYLISMIVAVPLNAYSNCLHGHAIMPSWQWQLASFNIFLVYLHFALLLRYLPRFGLYVEMLRVVTLTMIEASIVFSVIVTAFAVSFLFLFKASEDQEKNPFQPWYYAILKTLGMFAGELTLDDKFQTKLFVDKILFTLLVLIGTFALTNLLVGLAVSEIALVRNDAELQRLKTRATYMLNMASRGRKHAPAVEAKIIVKPSGECTFKLPDTENSDGFKIIPHADMELGQHITKSLKQQELCQLKLKAIYPDVTPVEPPGLLVTDAPISAGAAAESAYQPEEATKTGEPKITNNRCMNCFGWLGGQILKTFERQNRETSPIAAAGASPTEAQAIEMSTLLGMQNVQQAPDEIVTQTQRNGEVVEVDVH